MTKLEDAISDIGKSKIPQHDMFATVVELSDEGVKIRLDGEEEAREIYYNSLASVNVGDRVYTRHVRGTILILGKLLYKKG